jgi:hypothetical protein
VKLARPALVLAVAGVSLLSLDAHAGYVASAPKPLVIKDASGDANALNGQGFATTPSASTPASVAGMDITSVTMQTTGTYVKKGTKKVFSCTGFKATLELAGPPQVDAIFRITATGLANASTYNLVWSNDPTGPASYLQYDTGTGSTLGGGTIDIPVTVTGNKVVWTVTNNDIKATNENAAKLRLSDIGAHDRTIALVATVPQVDEVPTSDSTFKASC